MSRPRWVWAVGLLRLARVVAASAWTSADTFLLEDVGECGAAIDRAVAAGWAGAAGAAAAEGGGAGGVGVGRE